MADHRDLDDFIARTRAAQRNIVFPDAVTNLRGVEMFMLRGSPNPTMVQRIGAWMFGMFFFMPDFSAYVMRSRIRTAHLSSECILIIGLGIHVFRIGFRRGPRDEASRGGRG